MTKMLESKKVDGSAKSYILYFVNAICITLFCNPNCFMLLTIKMSLLLCLKRILWSKKFEFLHGGLGSWYIEHINCLMAQDNIN